MENPDPSRSDAVNFSDSRQRCWVTRTIVMGVGSIDVDPEWGFTEQ